jgi:hypothetical protein
MLGAERFADSGSDLPRPTKRPNFSRNVIAALYPFLHCTMLISHCHAEKAKDSNPSRKNPKTFNSRNLVDSHKVNMISPNSVWPVPFGPDRPIL